MAKILRILRNTSTTYASFAAAKAKLSDSTFVAERKDGEAVLARYTEGTDDNQVVKSALGLYHVSVSGKTGVTILHDSDAVQDLINALQRELDTTQASAGLAADGKYVADTTEGSIIGSATSILDATQILATAISKEVSDRKSAINALDDEDDAVNGEVVTAVVQEDGKVKTSTREQVANLILKGFTSTGETGSLQIAASDSIGSALNKIENYFKGLDVNEISAAGQPIVKISQTNGKIAAEVGNIAAAHVTVDDANNVITATDVEGALTEIAKNVAANQVTNADGSITVTTPTGSTTTTDIKVHIKSGEGVIKLDKANGIYTDLDLVKIENGLPLNVKERYQLRNSNNIQIGESIDIYKDSALDNFYLGHVDDALEGADKETGESDKNTIKPGKDETALVYVMQLANGKYKLTAVNVGAFLEESEFKDGLEVANHVVKVKKDTSSETVVTEYNSDGTAKTNSDVITISESGIKIANIQAAINAAIGTLDVTDAAVAGKYVSTVSETNGKISVSRLDISATPLNNYSKGSDATAVGASDTINAAISKLENQVGAAKAAAKTIINTTVNGESASHMAITKNSTAADGHDEYSFSLADVASEDALEAEVSRAETAEKTLAESIGCAYNDSKKVVTAYASTAANAYARTNQVNSDIAALDAEVGKALNGITSANAGIVVGTKSNKSQEITLTLDTTTASTDALNQYANASNGNALQITESGLYLSSVWDCGSY